MDRQAYGGRGIQPASPVHPCLSALSRRMGVAIRLCGGIQYRLANGAVGHPALRDLSETGRAAFSHSEPVQPTIHVLGLPALFRIVVHLLCLLRGGDLGE